MSFLDKRNDELQSAWLYRELARAETDAKTREMFTKLAGAAEGQAAIWGKKHESTDGSAPQFEPSARARLVGALIRRIGGRRMRPALAAMKVRGLSAWSKAPVHDGHVMPRSLSDFGSRHRSVSSGGNLRAAVFGVNDGLVSNASLILGVSGAGAEGRVVVLSGLAGLLAGAFSMAAGEYVSVRSQRELFEHQIGLERDELAEYPEEETEEVALIYQARGLPLEQARALAGRVMQDPERALDTLAREELGLNPDDLGSPWGAALSSFVSFAFGATIPLAPFLIWRQGALWITISISIASLFLIGSALSLFTGRSAWWSGLRMVLIGGAAGLATWCVGSLLGVQVT
jgi:vacuolar iron transporter family protein